jgi:hypothetical protein
MFEGSKRPDDVPAGTSSGLLLPSNMNNSTETKFQNYLF